MSPEEYEASKKAMDSFLQLFGWEAFEELVKDIGFVLVETRRVYRYADGSEFIFIETEKTEAKK